MARLPPITPRYCPANSEYTDTCLPVSPAKRREPQTTNLCALSRSPAQVVKVFLCARPRQLGRLSAYQPAGYASHDLAQPVHAERRVGLDVIKMTNSEKTQESRGLRAFLVSSPHSVTRHSSAFHGGLLQRDVTAYLTCVSLGNLDS